MAIFATESPRTCGILTATATLVKGFEESSKCHTVTQLLTHATWDLVKKGHHFSKNCETSLKQCILTMFLQRTVKCEKTYFEKYFFLQIGYTEEIRAVNYHFFVQKSAQYRHKILNVCVKVWSLKHHLKHRTFCLTMRCFERCISIFNDAIF